MCLGTPCGCAEELREQGLCGPEDPEELVDPEDLI